MGCADTFRSMSLLYGWVIVFAATIGTIASIPGQTMGFTVFTDVLMEELWSSAWNSVWPTALAR